MKTYSTNNIPLHNVLDGHKNPDFALFTSGLVNFYNFENFYLFNAFRIASAAIYDLCDLNLS